MPIISASNLTKIFGKKSNALTAVDNIDLKIEQGETVAITGKSGSGKSTLMHLLALLDTPTDGEVTIFGKNSADLKKWEINDLRNEKFGFVFQQFFMNPRDSVLKNVALPLEIAGVDRSERRRRALKTLEMVGLADKAKTKAKDLSGGQKQRVCIARALVNNPEIIFADEPTGNLDSVTGEKIEDLLFDLNKNRGITLIIVTHDIDLAKRCSRRIYIKDGKVIDYSKRAKKAVKTKEKAKAENKKDNSDKKGDE